MNEEHHLSPLISYNAISPKSAACDAHENMKKTVKRGMIRSDFSGFRVHQSKKLHISNIAASSCWYLELPRKTANICSLFFVFYLAAGAGLSLPMV